MRDTYWNHFIIGAEPRLSAWLKDRGSLTQRISQRCKDFRVEPLATGRDRVPYDEAALLNEPPFTNFYTRDVLLVADNAPVVFAHSAVACRHLNGTWHSLQHLGNRSLGTLLFTHPRVIREPLTFCALKPSHPLHRRTVETTGTSPARLWARRSLFTLNGAPLLVTEVFLPEILKLPK